MPTGQRTQLYPYNRRRWQREVLIEAIKQGERFTTIEDALALIVAAIRRTEPDIAQKIAVGACDRCGYAYGWVGERYARCWACGHGVIQPALKVAA